VVRQLDEKEDNRVANGGRVSQRRVIIRKIDILLRTSYAFQLVCRASFNWFSLRLASVNLQIL